MNKIISLFKSTSEKIDWPPMAYDDNDLPILLIGGYIYSNNVPVGTYDQSVPIYRTKNEFRQNGRTLIKFKITYDDIDMEKIAKNIIIQ